MTQHVSIFLNLPLLRRQIFCLIPAPHIGRSPQDTLIPSTNRALCSLSMMMTSTTIGHHQRGLAIQTIMAPGPSAVTLDQEVHLLITWQDRQQLKSLWRTHIDAVTTLLEKRGPLRDSWTVVLQLIMYRAQLIQKLSSDQHVEMFCIMNLVEHYLSKSFTHSWCIYLWFPEFKAVLWGRYMLMCTVFTCLKCKMEACTVIHSSGQNYDIY